MVDKKKLRQLRFNRNWNNKLNCEFFTTIRQVSFDKEERVEVFLKNEPYCEAECIECKPARLGSLPPYLIVLDTGLYEDQARKTLNSLCGTARMNYDKVYVSLFHKLGGPREAELFDGDQS